MLIGWATGGIFFGVLGDRLGRARTMVFTILFYSVFTGLTFFALGIWDFLLYRFMSGLGVGGQFAVGAALVAEAMPDRARPQALGMLQALSAVGNVSAALVSMAMGSLQQSGVIQQGHWRWMFAVGILPALLAVIVMMRLREPERWTKAVGEAGAEARRKAGSYRELFGDPRWRRRALVGLVLASAGVIGLWGIGFFSYDLQQSVVRKQNEESYRQQGEAQQDREFLALLLKSPENLAKAKSEGIEPRRLLNPQARNNDARLLYAAALTVQAEGRPVDAQSVLAELDRAPAPEAAGKEKSDLDRLAPYRKPQTADERARRAEYLAAPPEAGASLDADIQRIKARSAQIDGDVTYWSSMTSLMFNVGAFFGIYVFSIFATRIGRRPSFAIFFLAASVSTAVAFMFMSRRADVFWMVPLMGFFQLSVFGGYAIYFPELFPTRLRTTGTSFCYNIGRYLSASGPAALGILSGVVFAGFEEPMRYAGVAMCSIFLIGILALPFAPETKDQPLPE